MFQNSQKISIPNFEIHVVNISMLLNVYQLRNVIIRVKCGKIKQVYKELIFIYIFYYFKVFLKCYQIHNIIFFY